MNEEVEKKFEEFRCHVTSPNHNQFSEACHHTDEWLKVDDNLIDKSFVGKVWRLYSFRHDNNRATLQKSMIRDKKLVQLHW